MSYHTSGSMRSYGGGYGTIQIDLDNTYPKFILDNKNQLNDFILS